MVTEHLYDRLRGPAKNMTVLANSFAEGGTERHEPAFMTISYGKGRVFHTVMGHSHTSMGGVAFQEMLIRGTKWAATGEVTFPPVNNKVLPVNRAAYRKVEDIKSRNWANFTDYGLIRKSILFKPLYRVSAEWLSKTKERSTLPSIT